MARTPRRKIREVTASTYTVAFPGSHGEIITNRGGGALTVTLPAPSEGNKGCEVSFFQLAAGDFVITTSAGDAIATYNNASADSLTNGQDNEEIGNGMTLVSDGTAWLTFQNLGSETATNTVADS
jgi:hypothetical protein